MVWKRCCLFLSRAELEIVKPNWPSKKLMKLVDALEDARVAAVNALNAFKTKVEEIRDTTETLSDQLQDFFFAHELLVSGMPLGPGNESLSAVADGGGLRIADQTLEVLLTSKVGDGADDERTTFSS